MNREELVTKADVELAKNEIILQMKELLGQAVVQPKKLLKSKDVMEMLDISASGLQNLRVNHVIPYSKIGGVIYYNYSEIVALLTLNRVN